MNTGIMRQKATAVYHQTISSLKRQAKSSRVKRTVRTSIKNPMIRTPHLIGKQPQQDKFLVSGTLHLQTQQQHISSS